MLAIFPSRYIHIGGDEADKAKWKVNPRIQARIKELGLADEHELQSWFIRQMDTFLTKRNRRLIGWDEILEGGLAENAVVMSWRGTKGGIEAARAEHDVVMTPTTHVYLDHYQSKDQNAEPLAIGGFLPLETVYSFEPIPSELEPQYVKHILGAQAQRVDGVHAESEEGRVHGLPQADRAGGGGVDAEGKEGLRELPRSVA